MGASDAAARARNKAARASNSVVTGAVMASSTTISQACSAGQYYQSCVDRV